jgi:iron complex outermembrane receptor protein
MEMKNRYKFLHLGFLLFAFLIGGIAYGQGRTVTGTVIDGDDNSPLPGVSILVKGTNQGTTTDIEGKFSVSVPEGSDVLVFSYVGYTSQEVAIAGRSNISVTMALDTKALGEVVVIGYGVQDKKEITSAVASVKSEDFNRGNVNDVGQLLQGKVAGLSVTRAGGNPNQGFNIRLRGLSTIGASTGPLIIIDGVIGADLNSVDPNDIETMDVLKDGSAAAIYGTRGSAGVIIITTKTGKRGRSNVTYDSYVAAEDVARTVQVMNADQFREVGGVDFGGNTNWYDEISRTAVTHVHNLALSGGNDATQYRISLNYRDAQGVALNTGFNQLNGRINLSQKALKDKLTLTMNLASTVRQEDRGFDGAFRYAAIFNPTAPVRVDQQINRPGGAPPLSPQDYAQFGGFFQQTLFDYFNPVAILEQNINERTIKRFNMNFQGEYELTSDLRALVRYSQNRENELDGVYFSKQSFGQGINRNGFAERRTNDRFNQLFETTLTYDKRFGDLNVTALAGYSYNEFVFEGFGAAGGNFLSDAFTYNNLGAALDFANGQGSVYSYKNSNKQIAFFSRVNLNYDGTYFLSATVRREGATQFGENNKWGYFPALSAGVTISNLVEIPGINSLKARASYGVTGSLPPSAYLSIQRFGPVGNFFFNGAFVPSFGPISNPNPNLKWETKNEYNFGLDFTGLKNRLSGSIDYFTRTTTDLIFEFEVPQPPNLFRTTFINLGELTNSGFEVALRYDAIQKPKFTWTPGINFNTLSTKLVSLSNDEFQFGVQELSNLGAPGQNNTPLIRAAEGERIGQIWGLVYDGINNDGSWRFVDVNGDGQINAADRQVIGNGLPTMEFGINNSFTFGKFDFNVFFRGALGHDLLNTYRAFYETRAVATSYNVVNTRFYDPNLTDGAVFNSIHVENASNIRLDNLTLGYTVKLPDNIGFNRLRLYVSGQNLFVISGYTGVDPEPRFSDGNPPNVLVPGIDRRDTWVRTRTYTFGINVGF